MSLTEAFKYDGVKRGQTVNFLPSNSAGKPEQVQNCSVVNESTDSFAVNCAPGFNGGLPQQFRLGVYFVQPSDGARILVANLTSAAPR